MYQGWQRKSAKGYWRLKKQPAKGKSENDFRKQCYTTGRSLKLLIITALMATSVLTPPAFLHWVSRPPRPFTSNRLCSSAVQCLLPDPAAGQQPGFLLHPEAKATEPGLPHVPTAHLPRGSNFPPVPVDKPPLLPTKTEIKSCHSSAQNPPRPSPHTELKPKPPRRPTGSCQLSALPPLLPPGPFIPPSCCRPGRGRVSCCSRWGLCMCSPLCWHGIPPNVQKARGLAGFRSAQTSFQGGLSWSPHIKPHTRIPSVPTLPPSPALLSSKAVISTWHTSYLFTVFPRQNVSSTMAWIHWIYSQFYSQGMG